MVKAIMIDAEESQTIWEYLIDNVVGMLCTYIYVSMLHVSQIISPQLALLRSIVTQNMRILWPLVVVC